MPTDTITGKVNEALRLGEVIQKTMVDRRPLISVIEQLRYIQGISDRDQSFDAVARERLTIGLIAAREFETTAPEFARLLYDISYALKKTA